MGFNIHRSKILLIFALLGSVLVVGLRGTLPQDISYQTGSLQSVNLVEGIGPGGPPLWTDNLTDANSWQLSTSTSAVTNLQQNGALLLGVTFFRDTNPQAVTMSKRTNISLGTNPYIIVELEVSQGVHYGIRFFGTLPDGTKFDAWRENSENQHRSGTGTVERLVINLQLEAYLANGEVPLQGSYINQVLFYVEATPGTEGVFALRISALQAFPQSRSIPTESTASGAFYDILMPLTLPATTLSLFQVFLSFEIRGDSGFEYVPFLVNGSYLLAEGFTYRMSVTDHQEAVLLPQLARDPPPFVPSNSTEVIIVAKIGMINYFKLDNLTLKYTSTPLQTQGPVDASVTTILVWYYLLFLFVTPTVAVILLTRVFRSENE